MNRHPKKMIKTATILVKTHHNGNNNDKIKAKSITEINPAVTKAELKI